MEKEKIAVIDLGTNTFHLLVAEKKNELVTILVDEKVAVKIGQGGISNNVISDAACERALNTLVRFSAIINEQQVKRVYGVATSAFRNASNGEALVKDIKDKAGIDINIISGVKEAALIYEGVKYGMNIGKNTSMIMDIGGGSVEFIIGNNDQIFWSESFEIGAQRLLDKFHQTELLTEEERRNIDNFLLGKLGSLFEAVQKYKPLVLIGSSGSFDTLCDIDVKCKDIKYSRESEKQYVISIEDFKEISKDIISKTKEERLKIPGMLEMRVEMIVVACVLIEFTVEEFSVQKIIVSPYALKEGILSKALKGEGL